MDSGATNRLNHRFLQNARSPEQNPSDNPNYPDFLLSPLGHVVYPVSGQMDHGSGRRRSSSNPRLHDSAPHLRKMRESGLPKMSMMAEWWWVISAIGGGAIGFVIGYLVGWWSVATREANSEDEKAE